MFMVRIATIDVIRRAGSTLAETEKRLSRAWQPALSASARSGDPFDRPPEAARGFQTEHVFGIETVLLTESAAGVGRHHTHPVARHLEDVIGKRPLNDLHALGRDVQRETTVRIAPDTAARLDRHRIDPIDQHTSP